MRLSEVGEKNLIRQLVNRLRALEADYEINDVGYLRLDDKVLAVSIDGFCESTWILPFLSWRDVGRKALYAALADLLVKFSRPLALAASLCFTRNHEVENVRDVIDGLLDVAKSMNMRVLKLDTNEGREFSIHICVIGESRRKIGTRTRPGLHVYTIPLYGYTGIVFKLLSERRIDELIHDPVVRRGIDILRQTLVPAWIKLAEMDPEHLQVGASTDTSDGLGAALWTVAESSNIIIEINELPAPEEVVEFCRQNNIDPVEVVFNGAEDYLPVLFTREKIPDDICDRYGLVRIGHVSEREGGLVIYRDHVLRFRGWEYFRY